MEAEQECATVGDVLDALKGYPEDTPVLVALDMQVDGEDREQGLTMPLRKICEVFGGHYDGALVAVPWMPEENGATD